MAQRVEAMESPFSSQTKVKIVMQKEGSKLTFEEERGNLRKCALNYLHSA